MKLHNIYKAAVMLLAFGLATTSCNDFLDVRPSGEKVEGDLFETSKGFEDAIYGVYGSMASTSLYGKDLLWGLTDIMAQDLSCTATDALELGKYNYDNQNVRDRFSTVWTEAYKTIGYANNVLYNLNGRSDLQYADIYRGEMLAVRALMHFDLLRIFASTDKAKTGIPYADTWNFSVKPFYTVGGVLERIEADLIEAEKLLKDNDEKIMVYPRDNNQYDAFMKWRETHMNVWAVRALLARVYFYSGNMAKAASYATDVIESGVFPLVDQTEVGDYIAGVLSSKETIFGIYAPKYYATSSEYLYYYTSYKSYSCFEGDNAFYPWTNVFTEDVAATSQDMRRINHFRTENSIAKCLKLFDQTALSNSGVTTRDEIPGVSVMRVSELYLIAAEALLEADYPGAVGYFNDEISSRGLTKLSGSDVLDADRIYHEFHKELFCEGQVWYNMKRLKKDVGSNYEKRVVPAGDEVYVVPVPAGEYEYRN